MRRKNLNKKPKRSRNPNPVAKALMTSSEINVKPKIVISKKKPSRSKLKTWLMHSLNS